MDSQSEPDICSLVSRRLYILIPAPSRPKFTIFISVCSLIFPTAWVSEVASVSVSAYVRAYLALQCILWQ